MRKRVEESKVNKSAPKPVPKPVTFTPVEASVRHQGTTPDLFRKMCLKGKRLLRWHRTTEAVPPKEKVDALFAQKVGKYWHIPASELDRVFLSKANRLKGEK